MPKCLNDFCAGCYEVELGKWIHPPKDGYVNQKPASEEAIERWLRKENEALNAQDV